MKKIFLTENSRAFDGDVPKIWFDSDYNSSYLFNNFSTRNNIFKDYMNVSFQSRKKQIGRDTWSMKNFQTIMLAKFLCSDEKSIKVLKKNNPNMDFRKDNWWIFQESD